MAELDEPFVDEPSQRDVSLAILTLLMRIYDQNMLIIGHHSRDAAAALWDLHASGETRNPDIWLLADDGTDEGVESPVRDDNA